MSVARYDIAVVGGGLVGSSLACALAPLGWRVAVVEAVRPQAPVQPSFDDRSLALNLASCRILEGLGAWDGLRKAATPIREVVVSELGRPGRVTLHPGELGLEAYGYVVEARQLGTALVERLDALDGITVIRPARVVDVSTGTGGVSLRIEGEAAPESLEVGLVVAADGAGSGVRHSLGIRAREKDYGQKAIVCNVVAREPHRGRAFERMTASGPIALLPQAGDRCGLVWCVADEDADELLELHDDEFLERATERCGHALGALLRAGGRSCYPLRLMVPDIDVAERVVMVGNAAHTIHPAGAQGFNLGLRDVAALAEVLSDAGPGADPGDPAMLGSYSEWRRPDREATVRFSDGIVSLFASPRALSRTLRTGGLIAHALVPALRRRLATQAMGYRGRVPKLAMGEPLSVRGGRDT